MPKNAIGQVFDALGVNGRCLLCRQACRPQDDPRVLDDSPLCGSCLAALPRSRRPCATCCRERVVHLGDPEFPVRPRGTCHACRLAPPPWTNLIAPFRYVPPMSDLLPRIKKVRGLIELMLLAELLVVSIESEYAERPLPEALVAVPMSWSRKLRRGFNHGDHLARRIGRRLGIPVETGWLRRTKRGPPQRTLSRAARRTNVRGAFAARVPNALPRYVALVDDVLTTGATAEAATDALHRAGIDRVDVWVTAHTPIDRLAAPR